MSTTPLIEALFNGLSNSSILILTALGLAITFGVMRVINMAHGEMLMLGAYTAFFFTDPKQLPGKLDALFAGLGLEWSVLPIAREYGLYYAIPISFLVVGFI